MLARQDCYCENFPPIISKPYWLHLDAFGYPIGHSIQNIFDIFCVGTLNIGIDRRYSSPSIGGLGLVRNRDFLISQHTIWLKRAKKSVIFCFFFYCLLSNIIS